MALTDDFKRLSAVNLNDKYGRPYEMGPYSYELVTYHALREMREMSPEMINAMLETPWPEGMSAQDQMQAMFRAAIDRVLGDHAPADDPPGQG